MENFKLGQEQLVGERLQDMASRKRRGFQLTTFGCQTPHSPVACPISKAQRKMITI